MKDDLPTLRKEIKELQNTILHKGMKRLRSSNIRKQQRLEELQKKLNEKIHEEKTKTI